jgi:hypothetical protein
MYVCYLQIKDRLLLEEKKMSAFDLRKQRETNRKFNKQVADLKKQEKNTQTKHQIAEVNMCLLCVCLCVFRYLYKYICIYIYTCIYILIQIYVNVYVGICID